MKEFKDLKIKVVGAKLIGEKIKIKKVVDKEIVVHGFYTSNSKFEDGGQCLNLQIEFAGEKRVVFTRGSSLISALEQMDKKEDFPFKTTIVRETENGPYEFR